MSHKNGGQKREWRYPTACVGSYFIPDENIQTYLICLQSCNMQKHLHLVFPFPPTLIAVSECDVLWTATCAVISLVGSVKSRF